MDKPRTKRPQWLPVVAAIIRRENSVLLGVRPETGHLAGKWEFPGGKIELGEQPEQALKRELKEELGIDAEIGPLRFTTTHNYSEVGVIILFFEVNYWTGQPQLLHHNDLKWFHADELSNIPMPEANRNILDRVRNLLK